MAAAGATNRIGRLPEAGRQPFFLHQSGLLDSAPRGAGGARTYRRSAPSRADHRRRHRVGRALMEAGAFDQREEPAILRSREPYRPLRRTPGCAGLPDRAATADTEVPGPVTASSVCLQFGARHRHHHQADRCLSAQPRLAGRLCDEPDPRHSATALSRRFRKAGAAGAGQDLQGSRSRRFRPPTCSPKAIASGWISPSSNFPHFDVNPNSGEPEGEAAHPQIARNRIHLDRDHPHMFTLPWCPAGLSRTHGPAAKPVML